MSHDSHFKSICERGQTDEKEKWNANPLLLDRAEKENKNDAVENSGDVSIGDSERSSERCISDRFASLAKNWAPEMLYGSALIEANIEHRRCAGSGEHIRKGSRAGMYVDLHCLVLRSSRYLCCIASGERWRSRGKIWSCQATGIESGRKQVVLSQAW